MTFFCFNDTATTEIYTLSLHDALPIWPGGVLLLPAARPRADAAATIVAHLRRAGLRVLPVTGWEDHDARILASGTLVADVVTSAWPQGCLQVAIRRRPRAGRDVLLGAATAA